MRQLPEIEYKLRSTRLGSSPLYFQVKSSLHYLDTNRSARRIGRYGRAHLEPEISVPIPLASWFSLSLTAGGHLTWYEDSLISAQERRETMTTTDFRGEDLMRVVPTARAEIVGPGFSRIFELGEEGRFSRLKHVIEPPNRLRLLRGLRRTLSHSALRRDRQPPRPQRRPGQSLQPPAGQTRRSRARWRLRDPVGPVLPGRVARRRPNRCCAPLDRSLTSQNGPVGALLRFNPSRRTGVRFDALYDTLFSQVSSTAISGSLGIGETGSVGLRWAVRRNPELDRTRRHHVQVSTGLDLIPNKLRVNSMVSYDIEQKLLQIQRHIVDFKGLLLRTAIRGGRLPHRASAATPSTGCW